MQYHLAETGCLSRFQRWAPRGGVHAPEGVAFFCVGASHPLRRASHRIVTHVATRAVWCVAIALSTLLCCAMQPRYVYPAKVHTAFFAVQCVCIAFFWLRMLLEVVAYGVVLGRRSFLRSVWNLVEVAVNVFGILQLIPPTNHIRWMRAFVALRPVRLILLIPALRSLATPLGRSFPYLFDVALTFVLLVFWFGMMGVLAIGDRMSQHCYVTSLTRADPEGSATSSDSSSLGVALPFAWQHVPFRCGTGRPCPPVPPNFTLNGVRYLTGEAACLASPAAAPYGTEKDKYYQFKNIGAALLVVLQTAMVDNWYEVQENFMSVLGAGAAVFPVVVVSFSFCTLGMICAVVQVTYAQYSRERRASHCVTQERTAHYVTDDAPDDSHRHANILAGWSSDQATSERDTAPRAGGDGDCSPTAAPQAHSQAAEAFPGADEAGYSQGGIGESGLLALVGNKSTKEAGAQTTDPNLSVSSPHNTTLPASLRLSRTSAVAAATAERSHAVEPPPPPLLAPRPFSLPDPPLAPSLPTTTALATLTRRHSGHVCVRCTWGDSLSLWEPLPFLQNARRHGTLRALAALETTTRMSYHSYERLPAWRMTLCGIAASTPLSLFLELTAFANVVLLAIVFNQMRATVARNLAWTSAAMSMLFLPVLALRLVAFGIVATARDAWNYVDLVGGVSGILEFAIPSMVAAHPVVCGILRALRTLHLLKYVLPSATFRYKRRDLAAWLALAAGVTALYSLLGMQLFATSYARLDAWHSVRASECVGDFSTIWTALLVVFTAFTGANVSEKVAHVFAGGTIPTGALFFFSLAFLSFCVLQPLLLAILTDGFKAGLVADCAREDSETPPPLLLNALPLPALHMPSLLLEAGPSPRADSADGAADLAGVPSPSTNLASRKESRRSWRHRVRDTTTPPSSRHTDGGGGGAAGQHSPRQQYAPFACVGTGLLRARTAFRSWRDAFAQRSASAEGATCFYLFPPAHVLRRGLLLVLGSPAYRVLSTLCVLLGIVALFFERHRPRPSLNAKLHKANIAFVVVFWAEMFLKCAAYGVVRIPVDGPPPATSAPGGRGKPVGRPYLWEPINWVDVAVNGLTFGGLFYPPLRVGRALHTLRLLTSQECPNPIIHRLIACTVASAKVLPFLAVAYALFAVLGLHLFAGRLHICTDPAVTDRDACRGMFNSSAPAAPYFAAAGSVGNVSSMREWVPTAFRYDHFGHALLSVLVASTVNNWTALMTEAMSAPSLPPPRRNSSEGAIAADMSYFFRGPENQEALSPLHSGYYVVYFIALLVLLRMVVQRCVAASIAAHLSLRLRTNTTTSTAAGSAIAFPPCEMHNDYREMGDYAILADSAQGATRRGGGAKTAGMHSPLPRGQSGEGKGVRPDECRRSRVLWELDSVLDISGVADLLPRLPLRVSTVVHTIFSYRAKSFGKPLVDYLVGFMVLVHTGFMAARHTGAKPWEQTMFNVVDYVAIGVYALEALLRLIAYDFRYTACRLSFLAELLILSFLIVAVAARNLQFLGAFVVLKLIPRSGVDLTVRLCLRNWPHLINAVGLYFFVLLAYAVVGTVLLGGVDINSSPAAVFLQPGQGLTAKRNFSSVLSSLLVLFDCSTGDNWHLVLLACGGRGFEGGVDTYAAVVFFVSFVVVANLIAVQLMLAVFIGVMLEPPAAELLQDFSTARKVWARHFGGALVNAAPSDAFMASLSDFPVSLTGLPARKRLASTPLNIPSLHHHHTLGDLSAAANVDTLWLLLTTQMRFDAHGEPPVSYRLSYPEFVMGLLRRHTRGAVGAAEGCDVPFALSPVAEACAMEVRGRYLSAPTMNSPSTVPPVEVVETICFGGDPAAAAVADAGQSDGDGRRDEEEKKLLQVRNQDVLVPTGALPMPGSNLFLFSFPDEDATFLDDDEDETDSAMTASAAGSFPSARP